MSSADFVYRDDGAPDWGAMWSGFCELALFGGPPHRGEDSALVADAPASGLERYPGLKAGASPAFDAIAEIRRGIYETTGLESDEARDGWLPVRCESRKMAAWLCASIILENVDARCEGETLFVPAREDYELKNQVKSVITVVAKTHHYWLEHVAAQQLAGEGCATAGVAVPHPGGRAAHPARGLGWPWRLAGRLRSEHGQHKAGAVRRNSAKSYWEHCKSASRRTCAAMKVSSGPRYEASSS